jgi:hypothetical protein
MTELVETTEEDRMWDEQIKLREELEARDEELLPELREHVCSTSFGLMVHHPLIVHPFYQPGKAGWINYAFRYSQSEAKRLLKEKAWFAYLFLHAKPYRAGLLINCHREGMRGAEYWEIVGWAWTNSENIHENRRLWRSIWSADEPEREAVMEEKDRIALDALPDPVTVWRGTRYKKSVRGMSGSIDRNTATGFAHRFGHRPRTAPLLARGQVAKADVLAYFATRSESEIVSARVEIEDVITLPPPRPEGQKGS